MANEKRLIDVNDVIDEINEAISNIAFTSPYQSDISTMVSGMERVLDIVEASPTVDAVEVTHGHWEHIFEDAHYKAKCTACGRVAVKIGIDYCSPSFRINWHYCPNCGASMDGDI